MNFTRHLFTKRTTIALALIVLAMFCATALTAQVVAPSGSVIGNQATATYTDANNVSRTAFSNLVQTTVTQIYSGTLTASQTKYDTPGNFVTFPHTFTNTGNGPDNVTFTIPATSGNLSNIGVYIDANGDGVADNTTNISGTSIPVAAGATVKVVVIATLNAGSPAGSNVVLTAADGGHFAALTNTDTVTLSNNGVINVTKSMSASVGGISTVTLAYTNTGNASVSALTIVDSLATQGSPYFTYVAGTTKWNGTTLTDGTAPAGWNAFTVTGNVMTFNIGTVAGRLIRASAGPLPST